MNKKKYLKICCIILGLSITICNLFVLCCLYNKTFAFAGQSHDETAKAMVVIETLNNKVLYNYNEQEKLPMASTTKIITALTVLENCDDLEKVITVPKEATLVEGSSIYLREGERLSIKDLLYGLMLRSGNDAAYTLAVNIGGDCENFANLMNETAEKCGAKDSNFVTPHGLDDPNHYTTALDLAKITSYALKNPIFKEIVSTKKVTINATEFHKSRTFINKNKLLSSLDGCIGVKTGYTRKSGRCLVSACERDGMQIVCVVLNCRPMFEESAKLLNRAFEEYSLFEIVPSYKFISDVGIVNGVSPTLRIYNKNGFKVICKKSDIDKYKVEYNYEKSVEAPIEKDKKIGEVKVYFNKNLIFNENLCSIEKVDKIEQVDKIKNILDKW